MRSPVCKSIEDLLSLRMQFRGNTKVLLGPSILAEHDRLSESLLPESLASCHQVLRGSSMTVPSCTKLFGSTRNACNSAVRASRDAAIAVIAAFSLVRKSVATASSL